MKSKKKRRIVFYTAACIAITCGLGITALSFLLQDFQHYARLSLDHFTRETGHAVALGSIDLHLFPGIGIEINQLTIAQDNATDAPWFTCRNAVILTELLPLLLHRHLAITRIVLQEPALHLADLRSAPLPALPRATRPSQPLSWQLHSLRIINGTCTLANARTTLSQLEIVCARQRHDTRYRIGASGRHRTLMPAIRTTFEGAFNVSAAAVTPTLDLSRWPATPVSVALSQQTITSADRQPVSLPDSALDLTVKPFPDRVVFDPASISIENLGTVAGSVRLIHGPGPDPRIDLDLAAGSVALPQLHHLLQSLNAAPPSQLQLSGGRLVPQGLRIRLPLTPAGITMTGAAALHGVQIDDAFNGLPLHIPRSRLECTGTTVIGLGTMHLLPDDAHIIRLEVTPPWDAPTCRARVDSTVPATSLPALRPPTDNTTLSDLAGIVAAHTEVEFCGSVSYRTRIDLTNARCGLRHTIAKPLGIGAHLTISSDNASRGLATYSALIDERLQLAGSIQRAETLRIVGTCRAEGFNLTSITLPGLPDSLRFCGSCSGTGTYAWPAAADQPVVRGSVRLDNVRLHDRRVDDDLLHATVHGTLDGRRFAISRATVAFGTTHGTVTGTLERIAPPQGRLVGTLDLLDIDDFVRTVNRINRYCRTGRPRPAVKKFFSGIDLRAPLTINRLNFLDWNADNATTDYTYRSNRMHWQDIRMSALDGSLQGTVHYDLQDLHRQHLLLAVDKSNVDFLWAIPGLAIDAPLTGRLQLQGRFETTFRTNRDLLENMTGAYRVTLRDGRLSKFTFISKILSMFSLNRIMRFKAPDLFSSGMPFDTLSGTFELAHHRMHTDDLVLKSPAMNMTAVGDINMHDQTLDLTVGAQPLETLSKIMGSIPIAKTLFTDRNRQITVGYFHVQGPFRSAEVKALPMKSLGKAVAGFFKSFLDIPRDLLGNDAQDNASAR